MGKLCPNGKWGRGSGRSTVDTEDVAQGNVGITVFAVHSNKIEIQPVSLSSGIPRDMQ